jgi:PAS domain S-box-containing protein
LRNNQDGTEAARLCFVKARPESEARSELYAASGTVTAMPAPDLELSSSGLIGLFAISLDGRILDANEIFLSMCGYERADLATLRWPDFIPSDEELDRSVIVACMEHGRTPPFEKEYVRKDGSRAPVLLIAESLGAPAYCEHRLLFHAIDLSAVSRRRSAEFRDRNLQLVAEAIPHIVWRTDAAGLNDYFNDAWYTYTGLSPEESRGTGWIKPLHPDDVPAAGAAWRRAVCDEAPYDMEFRIRSRSGSYEWFLTRAIPLRDETGRITQFFGTCTNINEEKRSAQQLALYEHERRWSRTFQRAVLPVSLPQIRGCAFDAVYEPGLRDAQVGGDWYDAIQLPDGRILVSIGDVSGCGLQAAVVVGVARQIIRGISQLHADPMLILDAADRALCLEYPGVYVSAWVGLIDLLTKSMMYASAGHPPPLLVSSDGTVRDLADPTTMLIGLGKRRRGQANTAAIAHGDALVLYTDGITEAGRDVIAGTTLLRDAAAKLSTIKTDHPATFIKHQVIPDGSSDDVALLVVRFDYHETERHINRWQFDAGDGQAAGVARGEFVASLGRLGFSPEALANAELVFGELIGNVVRHARHAPQVDVAVSHVGPDTVLHVLDGGGGFSHISRLPRDPYAENGRGLFLIAALTEEFSVSERPDGGSHARAVLVRNNRLTSCFGELETLTSS